MVTQVHEHAQEAQRQQVCAGCHLLRIGDTPCRTLHFDEALRLIREGGDFTYTMMPCHDWSCHQGGFRRILQPNAI